ncbi:MAG: Panacea domain-containing protein [Acidimicrobiia bacterium]
MQLRFSQERITQAAARLLRHAGGTMPHISLIKLLYLSDRKAILEMGRPISFDRYASMPNGPVLSRTLDLISDEPRPGIRSYWREHISPPVDNQVSLIQDVPSDHLSPAEEDILDAIFAEFGEWDRWDLVAYTHGLPEWQDPGESSYPLHIRDILLQSGWSEDDANALEEDLKVETAAAHTLS